MRTEKDVDRIERAALMRYIEAKLKDMTLDDLREIARKIMQMSR